MIRNNREIPNVFEASSSIAFKKMVVNIIKTLYINLTEISKFL